MKAVMQQKGNTTLNEDKLPVSVQQIVPFYGDYLDNLRDHDDDE